MTNKVGIYRDKRNKGKPWTVRWFGEYDPDIGKQKRYTKSFSRKVDAENFAAEKTASFNSGEKRDRQKEITLKELCDAWLSTKAATVKIGSITIYSNAIRRLIEYFGERKKLSDITPLDAERFLAEQKPYDETPELSNATKHRILRNCRNIFNDAITWQLVSANPFRAVKAPKIIIRRWHYLKPDEFQKLLDSCNVIRWKAFYALGYTAGLRYGEMINLTWADIDFINGQVTIQNRQATKELPPFNVKDNERRAIKLPSLTLQLLKELQRSKPDVFKVPYVFLTEITFNNVKAKWKRFCELKQGWQNCNVANNVKSIFLRHVKKSGIQLNGQFTIHTLRKSCIQTWADHLPPNVTRELAGHSDIKTTMKYYNQVDDYHRNHAAKMMEDFLEKKIV